MPNRRSLYTCFNPKVEGNIIVCAAGHKLTSGYARNFSILPLQRGAPLELTVCATCPDYSCMGDPVLPADRGWFTVN